MKKHDSSDGDSSDGDSSDGDSSDGDSSDGVRVTSASPSCPPPPRSPPLLPPFRLVLVKTPSLVESLSTTTEASGSGMVRPLRKERPLT